MMGSLGLAPCPSLPPPTLTSSSLAMSEVEQVVSPPPLPPALSPAARVSSSPHTHSPHTPHLVFPDHEEEQAADGVGGETQHADHANLRSGGRRANGYAVKHSLRRAAQRSTLIISTFREEGG